MIEDGRAQVFGAGAPRATIHVRSSGAWVALLRGSRGLGESYMAGLWDTPDLTAVIPSLRETWTGSTGFAA